VCALDKISCLYPILLSTEGGEHRWNIGDCKGDVVKCMGNKIEK